MKTRDLVYTIAVILFALILAKCLAMWISMYAHGTSNMNAVTFAITQASVAFNIAVYVITAALNIRAKALRPINTIVQCVFLTLSGTGIPLAIWGIILLVKQKKSANHFLEGTR